MTASIKLVRELQTQSPIKKKWKFSPKTLEQSMRGRYTCPCCSSNLLRHICGNRLYWRCSHCYQEMPALIGQPLPRYDMETSSICSTGRSPSSNQSTQNLSLHRHESIQEINILIVENNPDCRYLWEILLEDYRAKVMAFGSIKDALASLGDCIPDILICEIRFPDESVAPLIDQIKHIAVDHDRKIPIMVTSTYSFADFVHYFHYLTAEIAVYLLKPIDADDFVDAASKLVSLPDMSFAYSYKAAYSSQPQQNQ